MEDLEQVKVVPIDEFQRQLAEKQKQEPEKEVIVKEEEKDTPSGTETPEKVEVIPEQVQEEEKINSLFEKLKEEPKTEEPALSEDILKKLQEYEAIRQKVEQYESNPLVKALELGKLDEVAKKIAGVDTSKMSIEQMLEAKIKNEFNLEGDDLKEAIEEEMQAFDAKSKLEKARYEKELRSEISNNVSTDELMKELHTYEQQLKATQLTPEKLEEIKVKIKEQDLSDIDAAAKELLGGDIYGVEFNQEFLDDLKKSYDENELAPYIKGDKLNAKSYALDKFILKNWQKMMDNAVEFGKRGALKKVSNPDGNSKGSTPSDPAAVDQYVEAMKASGVKVQRVINLD